MRTRRGMTALGAGAGALVLVTAFAACALLSGTGVGGPSSGSVSSASAGLGGVSRLGSASPSEGGSGAAGSSGSGTEPGFSDTAGPGSGGTAGASGVSGKTPGPQGSGAPTAQSTAQATARATATATATATAELTFGPKPTPTPAPTPPPPCYVFPSSNVWNQDISGLSVASNSAAMISAIGLTRYLHPDFDAVGDGIPYNLVTSATPTYHVSFDYADESDPGPYPIPSSPRIESGSDRHLLTLDLAQCKLWEMYDVRGSGSSWAAGSGAIFDLHSNALRPAGWTSADAAGLPIFPGLVRYAEVLTGSIDHAIRFTAPNTCGYIYPARHQTAAPCSNLPPMGLRVRLKASVDISGFGPHAQIVLQTLKRYGMILADNGSPWYISGVPDSRWDDDEMHKLQTLTGANFEVVNTSGLRNG